MTQQVSDDTIGRAVECCRPSWTVVEATKAASATDAVHYVEVETPEGRRECVLKICTAVPPADFRPEPWILELLERRTSVPGPSVVAAVEDHDELPSPFYLMEHCEGVRADDADLDLDTVEQVARDAGRFAGEYHDVATFERFGRIRVDDDVTHARSGVAVDGRRLAVDDDGRTTWRSWVEDLYEGWIDDLDERFVDRRDEIASFVEPRLDALDGEFDAVLGHVDYKPWNVLVRPGTGETTAVLDWGHATAMDPDYDLLLTEEHLSRWAGLGSTRRRRVRAAIEAGYAETNDRQRDSGFAERRALYLAVSRLQPLVWFSEWMADDSPDERRAAAAKHGQFVTDLLEREG